MIKLKPIIVALFTIIASTISFSQTVVNSLSDFQAAVQNSDQEIILEAGTYELDDLPIASRFIDCSGSNNTIDMTGVRIRAEVGTTIYDQSYFTVSGDNNVLRNGAIEDYYKSGLDEVTDFSAYNNDRTNLAKGLSSPVMTVSGNENLVIGFEVTVKGSFPYGYGSQYGINQVNTFGTDKRSGILITGIDGGGFGNTLDSVTLNHRAFGHGIFIQSGADETTLKNCYVEGRMRLGADMYNDTETYDLPYRSNYMFPADEAESWKIADFPWTASFAIPKDVMYPLSEDGIRSYNGTGSVTVENCTVKQMRGGIRLYLASSATVSNSTAIDCGATNFNMPAGSKITGSSGNFSYAPLSDFRLSRSRQDIEMTIIPSPNATGPHNLADVLGGSHNIVFHRTPGPIDTTTRPIVVYGNNSTIVNETEYTIVLESGTSGNKITSCGPVIDNGNNTVIHSTGCFGEDVCNNTIAHLEAECLDEISGAVVEEADENGISDIGSIRNGYWSKYNSLNLSEVNTVAITASSAGVGGQVELRVDSVDGKLIGTVDIPNTGNWNNWQTFTANINRIYNTHDLYLVFKGEDGWLYNIDFFGFSEAVVCNNTAAHIEAECYDDMDGIRTENSTEGTLNIGWINNGDWTQYNDIDLTGMKSIDARISSNTIGSIIEIRLDAIDGELIGEIPVTKTFGIQHWKTNSANITPTAGVHDIYLVFTGGDGYLHNINWVGFSEEKIIVTSIGEEVNSTISFYPNPTSGIVNFSESGTFKVFNSFGQMILSGEGNQVDLSAQSSGVYMLQVVGKSFKIIKK